MKKKCKINIFKNTYSEVLINSKKDGKHMRRNSKNIKWIMKIMVNLMIGH